MKILIGTPVSTGQVTIQYLIALRALEKKFRTISPQIESQVMFGTSSFMPFSRNAIASILLEDKSYTHLLFIDADMGFQPEAVLKLINSQKSLIGCMYPKREINFERYHRISREIDDADLARSIAHDYAAAEQLQKKIVTSNAGAQETIYNATDGLVKTLRLGMGLTLIRREVIEKMATRYPELLVRADKAVHYAAMGLRGRVIQCFSSLSVENISFSEDLSFCHRWVEGCGGEIWACTDQILTHTGDITFAGRLQDKLDYEDGKALAKIKSDAFTDVMSGN